MIGREHDAALGFNERVAEGIGVSSAHLGTDGLVRRHGGVIDTKADIEPLEDWRCAPTTR
jgi:hypothetical protein